MRKILFLFTLLFCLSCISNIVHAQFTITETSKVSYKDISDVLVKIQKENFSRALNMVEVLIKRDSSIGILYYYQGIAQLQMGLNKLAYESFLKSYELDPDHLEVLYSLGNIHYENLNANQNQENDSLKIYEAEEARNYFELYISTNSDIYGKAKEKLKDIYNTFNLPIRKYDSLINAVKQPHIAKHASFIGGESKMYEFIGKNLKMPYDLKKYGISGRVFTSFIIDENGAIEKVYINKSLTASSDDEVKRVLYSMPKWEPAIDTNGNKVRAIFKIPVKFTIHDSGKDILKISFAEQNNEINEIKLLMNRKEYEKVLTRTKRFLKKDPNNIIIIIYAGIAAHNLGNTDLAIKNYLKAYDLQPDNLNVNYNLGTIYLNNVVDYSNENKAEERILEEALLAQNHLENYISSINDEKVISILESLYEISGTDNTRIDSLKNNLNYIKGITQNPYTPPAFPNGNESLNQFIFNNLVFPIEAMRQAVNGKVYVSFVVEENGDIGQIKVIRGLQHSCDIEVIRLIGSMPKWVPANDEQGNPVKSIYTLPINFRTQ